MNQTLGNQWRHRVLSAIFDFFSRCCVNTSDASLKCQQDWAGNYTSGPRSYVRAVMYVSVAQARLTIEVLRASYISSRDKRCTTYLLLTETTLFPSSTLSLSLSHPFWDKLLFINPPFFFFSFISFWLRICSFDFFFARDFLILRRRSKWNCAERTLKRTKHRA